MGVAYKKGAAYKSEYGISFSDGLNAIKLEIPRIEASFTGTGDLFAALLLSWLHTHSNDLKVDFAFLTVA